MFGAPLRAVAFFSFVSQTSRDEGLVHCIALHLFSNVAELITNIALLFRFEQDLKGRQSPDTDLRNVSCQNNLFLLFAKKLKEHSHNKVGII
jgi:hypothetical protein